MTTSLERAVKSKNRFDTGHLVMNTATYTHPDIVHPMIVHTEWDRSKSWEENQRKFLQMIKGWFS